MLLRSDLLKIRTPGVSFHALRDDNGIHLIDTGFIGAPSLLAKALKRHGWDHLPIHGILLTHGHLDHILNTKRIAQENGAWIAAPALDANHYQGTPIYHGWSRITGLMEKLARPLLGFQPFQPDRLIHDGDHFPIWHGLRAIHLPGHTQGHTGFHCENLRLLFCADLFASYGPLSHLPPRIFNSSPNQIPASLQKALSLDLTGLLPNHADNATPTIHLHRLKKLAPTLKESDSP